MLELLSPGKQRLQPQKLSTFFYWININLLRTQSNGPISYAANTLTPGAHRRMTLIDACNPKNSTCTNFFFVQWA